MPNCRDRRALSIRKIQLDEIRNAQKLDTLIVQRLDDQKSNRDLNIYNGWLEMVLNGLNYQNIIVKMVQICN